MIQIKAPSTLLFAVMLTGCMHFTSSNPHLDGPPFYRQDEYNDFLQCLKQFIDASSPDILPFLLKGHVIEKLMWTSYEFKEICLIYVDKLSDSSTYSPVVALNETINHIFCDYMRSARKDNHLPVMLEKIKSMDPIGLHMYLTQNNVCITRRNPSRRFVQFVIEFQAITNERMRLLNMKTNDSFFDIFDASSSDTPYNIPPTARDEIATEYGPLSDVAIDFFTDFVTTKISRKMYRIGTDNLNDYRTFFSSKHSDVQILYDNPSRHTFHAICILYKSVSGTVHVYDSLMRHELDDRQDAIIRKLFPFKKDIIFREPRAVQDKLHPTGAIFAILYASMLLLGKDPARISIKLNNVFGDETLYMRIHILNMLANRKLALLK